ncbi:MFS transporter [Pseudomaricurvus alkylphenolicus]|uniref:MFS transporter n=1 Tax=Pseudomaricurvus alkylphenolicus TaxID=1306991 RepID=UPI00141F01B0|nr:MFS transporter [Pseudomaricurvus alkylphenolicus]NIB38403.1 MFS transporter [Pseudomaricurvus alkylphenolicus]
MGISLSNFAIFSAPLYIGGLMDGFGFSERQAGSISTVEIGSIAGVCLLLSGTLSRIPLRYLAMTGAVLILAANLVTLLLDSYLSILIIRIIAGVGAGACLAATSALLSRMADPDRVMGMMLMINTVLMVIALTLMGYAKAHWMFGGFILLFTVVVLLSLPLIFFLPKQSITLSPIGDQVSAGLHSNRMLGVLGVSLLFVFCLIEGSIWSFSERSGTNLGISDGENGLLLALAQASGLLGAAAAAFYGDRISRRYPVVVGILLIGSAGMTIYQTTFQLVYAASLCIFSFGFFLSFPYLVGACARLDKHGRWAARANGINMLGAATAPLVAANIVSSYNYHSLGTFCLVLAAICLGMSMVFDLLNGRKTLRAVVEIG